MGEYIWIAKTQISRSAAFMFSQIRVLVVNFQNHKILCWGLMIRQPLWVISCHLPEKGRRETEEIVEKMKERDRGERGK